MRSETKMYSEFIKRNRISVTADSFTYSVNGVTVTVPLIKDGNRWYAGNDDASMSKKSAIYWYVKNNDVNEL